MSSEARDVGQEEQGRVRRVGITGAGTMGSGIALAALASGLAVTLQDVAPEMLERARQYLEKYLSRKGREAALQHLRLTTRLEDLADADVVIEAVPERLELKQEIFRRLDELCAPTAVLASNTSTLPITAIAAATSTPERVAGMHFFNPAAVMPLVEVVRGARTGDETVRTLVALAERMGKTPVVTRDTPGFIVNRVARPFYLEALRLLGEGVATHEEIDRVVELGGGFRMGPFRLMDLIGIDVNLASTTSIYEQTFHEPRFRPHPLQQQMVQQNALGRKTGRGFYRYDEEAAAEAPSPPEITPQSGTVWISPGTWAPGLAELCQEAGYTVAHEPEGGPVAAVVVAGREEDMREHVRWFDERLPAGAPLLCQAADVTVGEIATWVGRPERLVGFDGLFFAHGRVATLVASPMLAEDARAAVETFVRGLGRLPVWIEDAPALILPRIVFTLANEAFFAIGEGVADGKTIDRAMKLGSNYPQGPVAWAEEFGYTRVLAVLDHLRAEYGEERYRAAPLLRRLARQLAAGSR